jgi:hypothetical protein
VRRQLARLGFGNAEKSGDHDERRIREHGRRSGATGTFRGVWFNHRFGQYCKFTL